MGKIYVTRHGQTYASILGGYNPDARKIMFREFGNRLNRAAVVRILNENETQVMEFLERAGLPLDNDFDVGDVLTSEGHQMAFQLGRYLVGRDDISEFRTFVPTKKERFLLRNLETAEGIQKGFGASELNIYKPDSLTTKFGDYVSADSERIPEFADDLRQLDGRIVVLNAGILEGIVRLCGGNVEEFDHCGLAVFGCGQNRIVLDEDYRSLNGL